MNNQLNISAILDEPVLLTQIVEDIASCGSDNKKWGREIIHPEWKTIATASTEVYVSGTIGLMADNSYQPICMPFTSNFIFTCIQEKKKGEFQLTWGISRS